MEVAQPVELQSPEAVVTAAGDVTRTGGRRRDAFIRIAFPWLLPVIEVHDGAGRCLQVHLDETSDDAPEVDLEVVRSVRADRHGHRQSTGSPSQAFARSEQLSDPQRRMLRRPVGPRPGRTVR
jgi:hypothetical protein